MPLTTSPSALHAVARFQALGWSPVQSYAMVSNDWAESLLIPAIVGDKGLANTAHGIAQWRGDRFAALKAFAAAQGKTWDDLDIQIEFQDAELRGAEKAAGNRLKDATTILDATKAAIGYHRPRGYTLKNPEKGEAFQKRLDGAQALADALTPKPAPVAVPVVVGVAVAAGRLVDAIKLVPGGVLEQGSQGPAVALAQHMLAGWGYPLKGTGLFAGATDVAVRDYQGRRSLTVDGQIGPMTAKDMDSMVGFALTPSPVKPPKPVVAPPNVGEPLWLTFARQNLGVDEVAGAGNNPKIIEWAKNEGGSIAKNYKNDATAWCALAMNMIFTKCSIRGTETLWALDWDAWGVKLSGPAIGAVAAMKRFDSKGKLIGGHVICVAGRDKAGNIVGWSGNTSDTTAFRSFPRERLLSYRWPPNVTLPKLIGFGYLPLVNAGGVAISTKED